MRPPKRETKEFEKVTIEDFTLCTISEVQYDMEHKFKGYEGAEDTIKPAVRFKLAVEGYQHPHYSRWMKFVMSEKSNLYTQYISQIVENAQPDMDIDLDVLKGIKVKVLWAEKHNFQFPETIRPIGGKLKLTSSTTDSQENPATKEHDEFGADMELPPEMQ